LRENLKIILVFYVGKRNKSRDAVSWMHVREENLNIILVFHVEGRNKADMWSVGYRFEKKT
jgi:hypothetical protein